MAFRLASRFVHTRAPLQAEAARSPRKAHKPTRSPASTVPAPAPAPVPVSMWEHPLYRVASRKPHQGTPSTAGDSQAPGSKLRHPTLSQRETYRAMVLDFRARAPPVLGGAQHPTVRFAPPIAIPHDAKIRGESTASLRDRIQQLKDLYKDQVSKGDYAPYLPKASLHDKSLLAADATLAPEQGALVSADQAMHANISLHPNARRFIIERIGAHVKVPC